jgi:tRNA A37 N6-isopentenylltransferase MiaA
VQSFAGIGYREIGEMLASCSREMTSREPGQQVARATMHLKSNILVSTRQYAKRQLTWFAREPKLK